MICGEWYLLQEWFKKAQPVLNLVWKIIWLNNTFKYSSKISLKNKQKSFPKSKRTKHPSQWINLVSPTRQKLHSEIFLSNKDETIGRTKKKKERKKIANELQSPRFSICLYLQYLLGFMINIFSARNVLQFHCWETDNSSSIVNQKPLKCKNYLFWTDNMVNQSNILKQQQSYKKLGTRDSVLLVGFRVQGGQSLFFCAGGKSPRTVGFAEYTIPLSGHMRIQQDSSVSSQGSTQPQVRDSRPTL